LAFVGPVQVQVSEAGLLLMVRHFAEHAGVILVLTAFTFNAFCMDSQLHCPLVSMANK